jgi:small conductance mechanosensitive channel
MFESFSPFLRSLAISVLIGMGGSILALLVSILFSRLGRKTWLHFFGNLVSMGIILWTIKLILDEAGAIGFVVILGTALTGAISLGSEHVASDLVAGIKLFLTRPFKSGDYVSIAGQNGEVQEVTLTYTVLLGEAGDRMIVRNSDVVVGTIFNYLPRATHRIEVQISVPANQDLDKALSAIQEAVKDFSPVSADDKHLSGVSCEEIKDGFIFLKVFAHISSDTDPADEKTRLMKTAFQALTEKKIELVVR